MTWLAEHLDGHRSRGVELDWRWQSPLPDVEQFGLAWSWLDTRLDSDGREIKYALDIPRHSVRAQLRLAPQSGWRLAIDGRWALNAQGTNALGVNARLSRRLGSHSELYLEASNLLDRETPEAGFAPLPGRWLIGGLRVVL